MLLIHYANMVYGLLKHYQLTKHCLFRLSGGRQKTDREYLVADRGASVLPVAFSLMASFMSAITLLGVMMALTCHITVIILL